MSGPRRPNIDFTDPRFKLTPRDPASVKRMQGILSETIRSAFADFIDDCRTRIELDELQSELSRDLKMVARLLGKTAPISNEASAGEGSRTAHDAASEDGTQ